MTYRELLPHNGFSIRQRLAMLTTLGFGLTYLILAVTDALTQRSQLIAREKQHAEALLSRMVQLPEFRSDRGAVHESLSALTSCLAKRGGGKRTDTYSNRTSCALSVREPSRPDLK